MEFNTQIKALEEAIALLRFLPKDTRWSLSVTDDDGSDSPSALNIFLNPGEDPKTIAQFLRMGKVFQNGTDYVSFKRGSLLVSLIEGE